MSETTGTLYLCATPIGNLEDMTPRALRMLREADYIAAEDTRHTRQLLTHFEIHGTLISYHEHNKEKQGSLLLEYLRSGKNIALVSDAGFPGISDPGELIAKQCIDEGIPVVPVPGANAALTALVASGLTSTPFFFGGFLPKSKKNRREKLEEWAHIPATMVLYEAPHRIEEVLGDIETAWGDRRMTMARELTKVHEEFFRGTVSTCRAHLAENPPRGEFVLVIEAGELQKSEPQGDPLDAVKALMEQGTPKKEALAQIAKAYKVPKRELYNRLLLEKGE
ncbi:MAG: 16S rRNA (cytidine(1402)-2'-O)-methyltransferase [Acidaminococcus sp.]|jgi:16S rRNA (cytidine1402-2'-O)-methyltransferase|nr:16S rRNA (cytidine(1402)-2'-O)-methyltransferase [Acidaminococcus sp.]MCI2099841.1 16S rRNA (cytidine(1402)-2'-O)-methyltransferase [Acidaminococcus sp.]MCI2114070.1 16S rRNA (cytidine(1402)-2'-O)-methyltransferase [Acidaminococcus sp.]MCI2115940.1 16S rRNA (cytidine(1402)-2'-O)-methyltransferase [Acidaminococcus sp.]